MKATIPTRTSPRATLGDFRLSMFPNRARVKWWEPTTTGRRKLAYGGGGLKVIDISDPASPAIETSFETDASAQAVAIVGDYTYVAVMAAGVHVIDISDPTNPTDVVITATSNRACDVVVSGEYAFVADYTSGFRAIDVTDPSSPLAIASYSTSYAGYVSVFSNYAYVGDLSGGLYILELWEE